MNRLVEAVSWSGENVNLSMFAVFDTRVELPSPGAVRAPAAIREYYLEDLNGIIGGRECYEYDLIYDQVPGRLDSIVSSWIHVALTAGAHLVWFGFEGSFHFDHLLARGIADKVYAVGGGMDICLALADEYRLSEEWATLVEGVKKRSL